MDKIVAALETAAQIYRSRPMESLRLHKKQNGDVVTDAEIETNQVLFEMLVEEGDGWLSEETVDNQCRMQCTRTWFVDPLDGTNEYLARIPEWCVSIALMENGRPIAAGILNPETNELISGSPEVGVVSNNGWTHGAETNVASLQPLVLASRSEVKRGEWERFRRGPFQVLATGSIAYKLALVAAGKADATWTLSPKNEWDVAAGAALLQFGRGHLLTTEGLPLVFNQSSPLLPGLVGFSATGLGRLQAFLKSMLNNPEFRDCLPWTRRLTLPDSETI